MPRLFGEKLRYLRIHHNMTQVDLAKHLGLANQGYISNLEAGRKNPSFDVLIQIADLFGVTTDYLLRDKEPILTVTGYRNGSDSRDPPEIGTAQPSDE